MAIVALLVVCSPAYADVITYEDSLTRDDEDGGSKLFEFAIEGFSPTLGTLTEIQYELSGSAQNTTEFRNTTFSAGTWTEGFFTIWTVLDGVGLSIRPETVSSTVDVGARETVTQKVGPASDSNSKSSNDAALLSFFTSSGDVLVDVSISMNFPRAISPGLTGVLKIDPTTSATFAVTYVYDAASPSPVPEPGSLALVGLGSLGLLRLRRRRTSLP